MCQCTVLGNDSLDIRFKCQLLLDLNPAALRVVAVGQNVQWEEQTKICSLISERQIKYGSVYSSRADDGISTGNVADYIHANM